MKKITELCILLTIGMSYLVLTSSLQISPIDGLMIIQWFCKMLCVVLSIGGVILVYKNLNTKINNKANYIAVTSMVLCLLHIIGSKYDNLVWRGIVTGKFEAYRLILEWFQIGMIVFTISRITESSNIFKYVIGELIGIGIFILCISINNPIMNYIIRNNRLLIGGRIITILVIIGCGIGVRKKIEEENVFYRGIFKRLFQLKIMINILAAAELVLRSTILGIIQYVFQVAFMIWIIIYIEDVTSHTWTTIELGVSNKKKEVCSGQSEQKTLVMAVKEIKYMIEQIVSRIEKLEQEIEASHQEKLIQYIKRIKDNGCRLRKLSGSILELNAYIISCEVPEFKETNLSLLVKNVIDSMETYISQQGITLECVMPKEHIIAEIDSNAIERIVINLISNAVKYNHINGKIRIVLSARKNRVYFCVQDSGVGIPNDYLDAIFEKFKRVDAESTQKKEGSGLGLAIVKSLVEMHKGKIKIVSGEGKGTIVSISLPQVQNKS